MRLLLPLALLILGCQSPPHWAKLAELPRGSIIEAASFPIAGTPYLVGLTG